MNLDHHVAMDIHIQSVCRGAYLQLKNIRSLRNILDKASLETVLHPLLQLGLIIVTLFYVDFQIYS